MDNEKKYKSKYKNVLLICLFVIIFKIIDLSVGELLYYYKYFKQPDIHSLVWNDFYKYDKNSIDVMFVGSSHARFAFDTDAFDKGLGVKTFNLSSSGQTPVVGYYALKEALKYQKPKIVVYETYWRLFGTDDNITPAAFVYYYVKGFDTKLGILSNVSHEKGFSTFFSQALSKSYKNRTAFIPAVKMVCNGNLTKPLNNYDLIKYDEFTYINDGFFSSDKTVTNEKLYKTNPFMKVEAKFDLNEEQIEYFEKTLDLCKENNIKVLMVTAPMPNATMNFIKNYDRYYNEFIKIADDYELEYIDYNLNNIETKIFRNDMFFDSNHLNEKGTKQLDDMLLPVLKKYLNYKD